MAHRIEDAELSIIQSGHKLIARRESVSRAEWRSHKQEVGCQNWIWVLLVKTSSSVLHQHFWCNDKRSMGKQQISPICITFFRRKLFGRASCNCFEHQLSPRQMLRFSLCKGGKISADDISIRCARKHMMKTYKRSCRMTVGMSQDSGGSKAWSRQRENPELLTAGNVIKTNGKQRRR